MAKNMDSLCAPMSSEELRAFRLRWKLSGAKMAKIVGVASERVIYRWESGTVKVPGPTARLVRMIADEMVDDRKTPYMQIVLDFIEMNQKGAA